MKKLIAIALMAVFVLSFAVPALAVDLVIDTEVEDIALTVTVPVSLTIGLNPLAQGTGATPPQVVQTPINIVNTSTDVSAFVGFYLDLEIADDVDYDEISNISGNFAITASSKKIGLGIIAAKSLGPVVFDDGNPDSIVEFDDTDLDLAFGFTLDQATGSAPATAFAFYGVMNAYAEWEEDDIIVTGVYVLKALSTQTTGLTEVTDTIGLLAASVDISGFKTASSGGDGTLANPYVARPGSSIAFSGITHGEAADVYVRLTGLPTPVPTTITFAQINPVFVYESGTGYTWNAATGVLHITQSWGSAGLKPNVVTVGDKSYTMNITVD